MGILYIIATPIGNLEDVSFRAIRLLGEVDLVLCEDTRVTARLLARYRLKTPVLSYHQHTDEKKLDLVLGMLARGKNLALVSDAGTPGISDPGGQLVAAARERFGEEVKVESVPGPSAVTAALSISGIPTDRFLFLGFLPHKKGRQTMLVKIAVSEFSVVVYESKHRILKLLDELEALNQQIGKFLSAGPEKPAGAWAALPRDQLSKIKPVTSVVVCRELSKMHETVYRGEPQAIKAMIQAGHNEQKGEFVVIIGR